MQGEKQVLDDLVMIGMSCPCEEIELDPEALKIPQGLDMKVINDLLRCLPFLLGPDGYGGSVFIGTRHHENPISNHSMITRKYIRGKE